MENVRRIPEEVIMARMAFLEDLKKGKLDNIHLWSFPFCHDHIER